MAAFSVLGATSWGLTLGWLLTENGHAVRILVRDPAEAERLSRDRGIARLPGLRMPESVSFVPLPALPAAGEQLVVAVPTQRLRENLAGLEGWRSAPVLSASKGIEADTSLRPSEVIAAHGWPGASIAVLSGPNLSHEVARGLPTAAVIGASDDALAEGWQRALSGRTFRVYRSDDVVGLELAGAMKNVIAIAAGVAWGLGFGANTVAALVTRGLAEIARLGVAEGARMETFLGLAGVGDLTATCFSPLSRNRRFGEALATGATPAAAAEVVGETVEGAATAPVVVSLAQRHGLQAPISVAVAAVVQGRATIADAMRELLARDLTVEMEAFR